MVPSSVIDYTCRYKQGQHKLFPSLYNPPPPKKLFPSFYTPELFPSLYTPLPPNKNQQSKDSATIQYNFAKQYSPNVTLIFDFISNLWFYYILHIWHKDDLYTKTAKTDE